MAIFEQQKVHKVTLDDTETIKCVIENSQNINGYTEYIVRVQRGPLREHSWCVYRRYNDFVHLHSSLQTSGLQLPFPPKKFIGNMSRNFIAERLTALQSYLNIVMMNPILASSLATKKFIDPDNYSVPFQEVALQHVSLALRSEIGWEVVTPLFEIGWRLRKHYFQIRNRANLKEELFASWEEFGPDKYLENKDIQIVMKTFTQLKHPYIQPVELCLCTETGGLAVRQSLKNGTLRDILCNAKPRQSFLKKYGNPKGHRPLTDVQVASYGRQILEALQFLHDKLIPYGHLHTGNIAIEGDCARLLDIENGILGVPSFYRPYFVQHKRISTLEAIDVYSFGHILYEMIFGKPLHESVCDDLPPIAFRPVLESILSPEACKTGLPSINSLLSHSCFNCTQVMYEKPQLKLPVNIKEQLRITRNKTENRLKEEQKLVRSQKKIARVQEMMSNEEELKKRRNRAKHQRKEPSPERSESTSTIGTLSSDILPENVS